MYVQHVPAEAPCLQKAWQYPGPAALVTALLALPFLLGGRSASGSRAAEHSGHAAHPARGHVAVVAGRDIDAVSTAGVSSSVGRTQGLRSEQVLRS